MACEEGYQVNAAAYQNLLVHIAVALLRIRENCYVPMETAHLADIKASREYPLACKMAAELAAKTGIELPEQEIAYISIHLAGKQMLDIAPEAEDGLVISDEVWSIVSEMLKAVWDAFRFDFRGDLALRMALAQHTVPLSVRLRYRMNLKNPLLDDIKTRYPLAYSMAIEASAVLAEHFDAVPSDDEAGYLALAFALALERQKTAAPKKTILMVCASGAGSARLLEYRCRKEFGDYIDTIITCDVLNLPSIDFSKIDYVFTTVPIARPLPVPVREVKFFLDEHEIECVKAWLSGGPGEQGGRMLRCFDRELFFAHLGCATKQEVIDCLLDRVCATGRVAGNFRELVWKREGTAATAFGNNVAMPHPIEAASDETIVAVGLLDEPIAWDEFGHRVQAVFLCSFARDSHGESQRFFSLLADLLISKSAIEELVASQSWDTLARLLAETERFAASR